MNPRHHRGDSERQVDQPFHQQLAAEMLAGQDNRDQDAHHRIHQHGDQGDLAGQQE
ncbi:MAG: hypothetical protein ABIA75_07905 [Candidatus Neomarinimicrobiota bacterium]